MLSRAKQCNVLWSQAEQQSPAAGIPAPPRAPAPAQLPPPGQESSPRDTNSISVNPCTLLLKVDIFSLWSQLFSSLSATLSPRTGAAAPWGADAAGAGSSLEAAAGPSREQARAVYSVAFIPDYTPHTLEEKQNLCPALGLSTEKATGS